MAKYAATRAYYNGIRQQKKSRIKTPPQTVLKSVYRGLKQIMYKSIEQNGERAKRAK